MAVERERAKSSELSRSSGRDRSKENTGEKEGVPELCLRELHSTSRLKCTVAAGGASGAVWLMFLAHS